MTYDLNYHINWFNLYSQGFSQGTSEDLNNLAIKRDHSLRVLQNALELTASLTLDRMLAEVTHLAALFHDVGRFPQYERFRTFNDRNSANHAAMGVAVLRETDALARLTPAHRRLVLGAIFLHNRQFIPAGLHPKLGVISRIIRDADKLDIFPVLVSHFSPDSPVNGVVTLNLKPHPTAYTEGIFRMVQSGKIGKYEEMVWINDLKLLLCSWVYDLNFPLSRKRVRDEGYLDRIFESLPNQPEFAALQEQLEEELMVRPETSAYLCTTS